MSGDRRGEGLGHIVLGIRSPSAVGGACGRNNVWYVTSQAESRTAMVEDIGAEGRIVSKTHKIFEDLQGISQRPGLGPRNLNTTW